MFFLHLSVYLNESDEIYMLAEEKETIEKTSTVYELIEITKIKSPDVINQYY